MGVLPLSGRNPAKLSSASLSSVLSRGISRYRERERESEKDGGVGPTGASRCHQNQDGQHAKAPAPRPGGREEGAFVQPCRNRLPKRETGELTFSLSLSHGLQLLPLSYPAQQKLREEREGKRASLDARHQYLCGILGMKLDMEDSQVEEFLLEGDQVSLSIVARCEIRSSCFVRVQNTVGED